MREEEMIRICKHCGEATGELFDYANCEGWTVCTGCGMIEGETYEVSRDEYENNF